MATCSCKMMRYDPEDFADRDRFVGDSAPERLDPMDEAYEDMFRKPTGTCPRCDEYVWVELQNGMCDTCLQARINQALAEIRKHPKHDIFQDDWAYACNAVLRKYNMEADHRYCDTCDYPTPHTEVFVPNETDDLFAGGENEDICVFCYLPESRTHA